MNIIINNNYKYIMIAITLMISVLLLIFKQKDNQIPIRSLTLHTIIPQMNDSTFLVQPYNMQLVNDSTIYVSDNLQSRILIFNTNGKLVNTIGEQGRGPGEFMNPGEIKYDGNKLIINDMSNRRIQFTNNNGDYISSFRTDNSVMSLEINNDTIFSYIRYHAHKDVDKYPLITVFDDDGNIINTFGSHKLMVPNAHAFASSCILNIYNNKLYILFKYYPVLQIYSLEGELVEEITFNSEYYRSLIEDNYKKETFTDPHHLPLRYLFRAFDVNEHGIFITVFNANITIDQYDFDGNFIQRFSKNNNGNIYVNDIKVIKEYDNKLFYILHTNEIPSIGIYGINQ